MILSPFHKLAILNASSVNTLWLGFVTWDKFRKVKTIGEIIEKSRKKVISAKDDNEWETAYRRYLIHVTKDYEIEGLGSDGEFRQEGVGLLRSFCGEALNSRNMYLLGRTLKWCVEVDVFRNHIEFEETESKWEWIRFRVFDSGSNHILKGILEKKHSFTDKSSQIKALMSWCERNSYVDMKGNRHWIILDSCVLK